MKTFLKPSLSLAAAAALLSGCSSGFHYSELSGQRYHLTNLDTHSVIISRVDGRSTPLRGRVFVEPGLRTIEVQGPPGGANRSELVTTELKIQPCTRYFLVAVKSSRLASDFEVRVDFEEPIAGCTPPTVA